MRSNGNKSSDFLSAPAKLIVLHRFNRHLIEHSIDVGQMGKRKKIHKNSIHASLVAYLK